MGTAAVAAKKAAASGATQAAGAVTAAATGLKTAQDAQKEAIKECQCNAKHAYAKAWEAANTNNDADAKTYTKGKHMKCVLDGTPPADCQVGDIPKVQAITLADGVEQAECGEAPTHTSKKVTCDLTIDNAVTDVQYNGQPVQLTGDMGNWNANKKITFDTMADGVLLVAGYDSEGGNSGHCKSAGFALQCQFCHSGCWWPKLPRRLQWTIQRLGKAVHLYFRLLAACKQERQEVVGSQWRAMGQVPDGSIVPVSN